MPEPTSLAAQGYAFGRKYELWVFDPKKPKERIDSPTGKEGLVVEEGAGRSVADNFVKLTADAVVIKNLRISGNVSGNKLDTSGGDVPCTLNIWNAADETKAFFKKDNAIILKLGYEDDKDLPTVFSGQIISSSSEKKKTLRDRTEYTTTEESIDTITKLVCGGNDYLKRNYRASVRAVGGSGSTVYGLFQEFIRVLRFGGASFAELDSSIPEIEKLKTTKLDSGYSVEGVLIEKLSALCAEHGLRLYSWAGIYYIESKVTPYKAEAVVIKSENVIGNIEDTEDNTAVSSTDEGSTKGIKFSVFLDGRVVLNKRVVLETLFREGTYKVMGVSYDFDTEGPNWKTDIIASTQ